jgi:hypothetical protein
MRLEPNKKGLITMINCRWFYDTAKKIHICIPQKQVVCECRDYGIYPFETRYWALSIETETAYPPTAAIHGDFVFFFANRHLFRFKFNKGRLEAVKSPAIRVIAEAPIEAIPSRRFYYDADTHEVYSIFKMNNRSIDVKRDSDDFDFVRLPQGDCYTWYKKGSTNGAIGYFNKSNTTPVGR